MANEFIILIIGVFSCISVFTCLEFLHRTRKYSSELLRRVAHLASSVVASIFSLFLTPPFFIAALCFFFLFILFSRRKKVLNHIHRVSRSTIGEELLPLGFITSYLIAGDNQNIYIPAFLIVGLADPMTGIVMEKYKKRIIGLLVFILVSIFILLFFKLSLIYVFIIAIVVALVERISGYGTDNLTIPITVALLLRLFT